MAWEEVWRGDSEASAEVVAGSLRAAGYNARVTGAHSAWAAWPIMMSNWSVVVPPGQAAAARKVLARTGDRGVADPRAPVDWSAQLTGLRIAAITLLAFLLVVLILTVAGR